MMRAGNLQPMPAGATGHRADGGQRSGRPGRLLLHLGGLLLALLYLAGCQSTKQPDSQPLVARFYLEVRPGETGVPVQLPRSGVSITVNAKAVFAEYDIRNAEVARVDLGVCLLLQLTPAAARDLYRLSVAQLGRRLVLLLNDAPLGVRLIEQAMPDGVILVFVEIPDPELATLVARLKHTSAGIQSAVKKS